MGAEVPEVSHRSNRWVRIFLQVVPGDNVPQLRTSGGQAGLQAVVPAGHSRKAQVHREAAEGEAHWLPVNETISDALSLLLES